MPDPADRSEPAFDLLLAGGGLANTLIAWRVLMRAPGTRIGIVEAGPTLGGNHTWSFHDGDLSAEQRAWLSPLVAHTWPRHAVHFAGRAIRWIETGYASIPSDHLHRVAQARFAAAGATLHLDSPVAALAPTTLRCADGRVLRARAVVDGRGFAPAPSLVLRHQKFLGVELALDAPHALDGPIVMDAAVPQLDGYRFVYVLPLAPDRLLVEDTYYADGAELDVDALRARIAAYARGAGWRVARTLREEHGVLPIALSGDIDAFWRARAGQPCSGLRAGLFHPTTGYSLPQAVRLADALGEAFANAPAHPPLDAPALAALIARHARATWRSQAFFRALNRMLFQAGQPEARHEVLAHFYRLPDRLVARFYGERLSWADKLRIVTGKPPVPIGTAMKAVFSA